MTGIGGSAREEIRAKVDEALSEDPVVRWIADSWKQVCLAIVLIFSVFYIRSSYLQNNIETAAASADSFARVRQAYEEYTSLLSTSDTKPEELEKKKRALEEVLRVLGDAKPPYANLAAFYLSALDDNQPITLADPKNITERLVSEVSLLKRARKQIDSQDKIQEGIKNLELLSSEGQFVGAESTIVLGTIATTSEEKEKAQKLITAFLEKNPSQRKIIEDGLSGLGFKF